MGFSRFSTVAAAAPVRSGAERATLVRRTYGLVFVGIVVSIFGAALAATQASLLNAVVAHPFIGMICWFAPFMMLQAAPRAYPRNLMLMLLFTFIGGVLLAPALLFYVRVQPGVLAEAGLLTFAAFGGLTLYAAVSRRDFSAWGGFFAVGLVVLLVTMVLGMFFHGIGGSLWIAGVGVFIFAGLLVFDTWRILRSGQFGEDDYVIAAVTLYLDVLNLFLFILQLVSGGDRRS